MKINLKRIILSEEQKQKIIRKTSREIEINNPGYNGFKQENKMYRNKRKYFRKEKHKDKYLNYYKD